MNAPLATSDLAGQWVGLFGTTRGATLAFDNDALPLGHVYVEDFQTQVPLLLLPLWADTCPEGFTFHVGEPSVLFDRSGRLRHASDFPTVRWPKEYAVAGKVKGDRLEGSWSIAFERTPSGEDVEKGTFELTKVSPQVPSGTGTDRPWDKFREEALVLARRHRKRFVYRGEGCNKRSLTTPFFRAGRYDLARFDDEDMIAIAEIVSASTGQPMDTRDSATYALLATIAQHHGYPTPLLDWSYSPMIAAYFAFERALRQTCDCGASPRGDHGVRVYKCDKIAVDALPAARNIAAPGIAPLFVTASARHNLRAEPQQSVHLLSKLGDAGRALMHASALEWFDLPAEDARDALRDLRIMGVTAASLMPGLPGGVRGPEGRAFRGNLRNPMKRLPGFRFDRGPVCPCRPVGIASASAFRVRRIE